MNAEYVTAASAFLTFLVIAVSAAAALVQLRQLRASNQLAGIMRYTEWWETSEMQSAIKYVRDELPQKLRDPQYRDELLKGFSSRDGHPELVVCDWVEQAGSYIKYGLLAESQFLDLSAGFITGIWDCLEPVVAMRRLGGGVTAFENFEYLAVRSKAWLRNHPAGNYPAGCARLMTQDKVQALVDSFSNRADV
jgi:hypothetical protein